MTPKFRSNLMALAIAMGTLAAGYGLGEPPSQAIGPADPIHGLAVLDATLEAADTTAQAERSRLGRGALKRQIAMPYVSMAALMPRQES
ncbi:hypothetical protein [Arenimonas caeni]|jgi:hypothetical protein|uniref:Uncharacterized protein n=1 Tax=Arenimonas caeni TaxID=2058085 RepID=A0A2P6M809_9GAMM|nr:hypothetical protein [Arenimonas caeni]MDY0021373.1 hypothetical protein [Arenimonas caeni]PRH82110.1 hypothetical protein C6N40_08715 [Arenimonas caeni]